MVYSLCCSKTLLTEHDVKFAKQTALKRAFALCPVPCALCPLPFALCPLPFANDGIDLPVTNASTQFDTGRTQINATALGYWGCAVRLKRLQRVTTVFGERAPHYGCQCAYATGDVAWKTR